MKTVIFCGGQGMRLKNMNSFVPKAMIKIAGKPILWHVMKIFAKYGHKDFVLALGSEGESIRDYFFNYNRNTNDVILDLKNSNQEASFLTSNQENDWKITFVDTGESAGTGARLYRCKKYLNDGDFFATYADCLSNLDLNKLLDFHKNHNVAATVTGVFPPFRYGEFVLKNDIPISYSPISKLNSLAGVVNGGFMVLRQNIFDYLTTFDECSIESNNSVFEKLSTNGQLKIYHHDGFWQCLDNDREYEFLNDLCKKNLTTWLV